MERGLDPSQIPRRRILSIDGGGIKGVFPAAFLAGLERQAGGQPLGSYFDLIAGTSTGGIIAIGLALGLPASEILKLYEEHGPAIFGRREGWIADRAESIKRLLRHVVSNKHSPEPLRAALESVFADRRIGHAGTRLLIPAWNPDDRTVYIYKTAHHPRLKTDYLESAVDAAMATSAAPTYFPQHRTVHSVGLSDGGTWANNPIGLAVVEAVTLLDWPRESIHVLSVGCTEETYTVSGRAGIATLGTKVISVLMDGQSHGAMGIAKLLTGHQHEREALFRVNVSVPRGTFPLDDPTSIPRLKGLGCSRARQEYPSLEPVFFDSPAEPFVPIYQLGKESSCLQQEAPE